MSLPPHPDDDVLEALGHEDLEVLGRIQPASNLALLARRPTRPGAYAIVKPVVGERPLWDFPDGTLAAREVATYWVSRATGLDLVPPTVLRPVGEGVASVQAWVGDPEEGLAPVADVVAGREPPAGTRAAFEGRDGSGRPVLVVHADDDDVRDLALLDVVLNQADRKGSHMGRDDAGRLWAFDHGLCLHAEPKLRTILWGWAGEPLRARDRAALERLGRLLGAGLGDLLAPLLTAEEVASLGGRAGDLLAAGVMPAPTEGWPSIPWPPL